MSRPTRKDLLGYSRSEFKTLLKRKGHKVPRDFFGRGCVSTFKNRFYRWRWWKENDGSGLFVVDISCLIPEFDRWANSVEERPDANSLIYAKPYTHRLTGPACSLKYDMNTGRMIEVTMEEL